MNATKTLKALLFGATLVAAKTVSAEDATLPNSMVWTSYDLGAAGYVEASAMADALDNKFGTRVRITPSGTGIGALALVMGLGFLGKSAVPNHLNSKGARSDPLR